MPTFDELALHTKPEDVDISRPLLVGTLRFRIADISDQPSKNGDSQMQVKLTLDQVTEDTRKQPVQPGFTVTHRINLGVTDQRTREMIARDVRGLQCAANGLPERDFAKLPVGQDTADLVGKPLLAVCATRDYNGETYQNIKRFLPVAPATASA